MITPANALKFSMWLAAPHPSAFAAVLKQVNSTPSRTASLGNVYARGRFGHRPLGDLDTVTVEPMSVDEVSVGFDPSMFSDPTLEDINFSSDSIGSTAINLGQAANSVDDSGGFWSSLGSGLSSIGGGLVSAIGTVAKAVTSPQVLNAAGSIAGAVIKNNATTQQAQLQQAVLQAQLQRTATGAGAAPVVYSTNPSTGVSQPYYYNAATGRYQLTQPALLGSSGLSSYWPYLLIGGGILVLAVVVRRTT